MDLKHVSMYQYSITAPEQTHAIVLRHRLHGDNRVCIHTGRRLGGLRGWIAEGLRRIASAIDGRYACVVEVDSTMPFTERELSKAFGLTMKGLCDNFAEAMALEVAELDVEWFMREAPDRLNRAYTPPPR